MCRLLPCCAPLQPLTLPPAASPLLYLHLQLKKIGRDEIRAEIVDGRQRLAECGIPAQSIVGFRAPYLESKPDVRVVLSNNGFLYDRWEGAQGCDSGMCTVRVELPRC